MRCVSGSVRRSRSESERLASVAAGGPPAVRADDEDRRRLREERAVPLRELRPWRRAGAARSPRRRRCENERNRQRAPDEARRASTPTTRARSSSPQRRRPLRSRRRRGLRRGRLACVRGGPCPSCGRRDTAGRASGSRPCARHGACGELTSGCLGVAIALSSAADGRAGGRVGVEPSSRWRRRYR